MSSEVIDRLHWIIRNSEGRIVDIGGNNGHTFGPGAGNVTVVDIDLYDIPNFVRADAQSLPFKDNEFDTAVLAEILEHVPNPVKVIKEARRVSKRLVITVPNEYDWDDGLFPFFDMEKHSKRQGMTPSELARDGNPDCKDFYDEDNYKHLYHIRWYTKDKLEGDLIEAGITDYTIEDISFNGFSWFGVIAN